ncbi:RNA-directed DNA polymerase, eukaryota, partial [Tanacetum coccineum]
LEIREMGFYRTKEYDVAKISTSIYVTNFPESTNAKELFHACNAYGHVVDSFIPNKRAKNGGNKINKMGTINSEKVPSQSARTSGPSFASVLQDSVQPRPYISPSPAMVLDDSCIVERVLEKFVMGEVKSFSSIPNLHSILLKEGFQNVNLTYMGGLWVMMELESIKIKKKNLQHVGVSSWFHRVCNAQPDFVANERIVWVDIEGVPLHAWSRKTFTKICSKWGEMLELEESSDDFFARKRICIKTKLEDNILEKFKIIIRGKIFVIRAKELFVWSPVFNEVKEAALCSDDESLNGEEVHKGENNMNFDSGSESDIEAVPDTCFGEVDGNLDGDNVVEQPVNEKEYSPDPFGIYGLMGKKDAGADISEDDKSIPYPPGFTPMNPKDDGIEQGSNGKEPSKSPNRSVCSRVVMDSHNTDAVLGSDERGAGCSQKKGGSVLVVLDDIIKIGKAMGYSMEGCEKDIEGIIRSHGFVSSELLGFQEAFCSGVGFFGLFFKETHIISDHFLVLYGSWKPNKTKLLVISIYAPQSLAEKRLLWNYISLLISRWGGECIVMGDFNEVTVIVSDEILLSCSKLMNKNARHSSLLDAPIRGIMVDGEWVDDPSRVKDEFRAHFADRFQSPTSNRCKLNFVFPNRLDSDRAIELESPVTCDEIRKAVWACGENKSPGPDGFTFEFFRKFWVDIGPDFCAAVVWFFDHCSFARGCNSAFIALIPKVPDPKFVNDFHPISLIGCLYKVVTKILAMRLSMVISDLISDVQTAFLPKRQILDGPFIINELLSWCKCKKKQAMVFKVDFAKAYDSIRWDYLDEVFYAFGFGVKWRAWIRGSLSSGMASIVINGSPTS